MNKEELEKHLENQVVDVVVNNTRLYISLLPPNGATIHDRNSILGLILNSLDRIEKTSPNPAQATFSQLKARSPEDYERMVNRIYRAHTELGIKL